MVLCFPVQYNTELLCAAELPC